MHPSVQGLLAIGAALTLATALGLWLRRSGRRLTTPIKGPINGPIKGSIRGAISHGGPGSAGRLVLGSLDLGAPLGERATLVAFSSAFCAPCRATRRVLDQVSSQVPGVTHIEIDAESHLDLVRALDVRRTPTVLVLDPLGRVVRRASGQPRPADVLAALGAAVPA